MCTLSLSLLQLKSGSLLIVLFIFLPVLMVSCLVTSPFVRPFFLTLLALSFAYFSEMSSIFERDRLFSFTCVPFFKLFIKELAGGNRSVLVCVTWCCKNLTEWSIMPASPNFMCYCEQGQHQRDYRFRMHV